MNALEELTPAMKFVLVEKFVREKSVQDIALESGFIISTAKLYLDKGLHRLRVRFNRAYRGIVD